MRLSVASAPIGLIVFVLLAIPSARASSGHDEILPDQAALTQMEFRAQAAGQREQCFLYTELVQVYTEVAGRQFADGQIEQANTTLKRIQHFADLIHAALMKDTKRVKDAEKIVHMASYHLGQYAHRISSEDKTEAESTLKKLDKVHDELLAQVFAH